jgi:hypothetical protein
VPPPEPGHNGLRWAAYADQHPVAFGLAVVAAIMASRVLAFSLLSLFVVIQDDETSAGEVLGGGLGSVILMFAVLPVETYLGQQLPISLLRRLGVRHPLSLVTLSALAFGALHLFAGLAGFVTGASAGVMLSYAFLCWQQESTRTAFWRTTAVHAVHNAIAIGLYVSRVFVT